MINHLLLTAFSLVVVATMTTSWPQESEHPSRPEDRNQPPSLKPVLCDDFGHDTRGDYTIRGDVSWEKGKVTLGRDAAILRRLNSGAWVKVELDVELSKRTAEQPRSELRVWFLFYRAAGCYVRLQTTFSDGQQKATLAVVDNDKRDGKLVAKVVRQTRLHNADINRLTIEYRHGLVQVSVDRRPVLVAYIDKSSAEIELCGAQVTIASAGITRLAASRARSVRKLSLWQRWQMLSVKGASRNWLRLFRQGKLAEAVRTSRQILKISKSALGEQNLLYADLLHGQAMLYGNMADHGTAEQLYKQALAIRKSLAGAQHPSYARDLVALAGLYCDMGHYDRAEPLYKQAIEIEKSVLGEQDSGYAASLNKLAYLYAYTNDYGRAELLYKQAMAIRKSTLGDQHPDYADSLNFLSGLYVRMGDYARAEPLVKQAVAIRKSALGDQHPDYATSLRNLGVLYERMGDYARAEPLVKQATEILTAELDEQHPVYANSLSVLAGLYVDMDDYGRAESLYKRAIEIRKAMLGDQHPYYASSLCALAGLYCHMGDYARAKPLYEHAMAIRKSVLGAQHWHYAISMNDLAVLVDHMGNHTWATPLLTNAESIVRRQLDSTSLVQSERQQHRLQAKNRFFIDDALSNAVRTAGQSDGIVQRVWRWKGAVTLRQQLIRQVAAQPKLVPLFADLKSVSRQWSTASGQAPIPPPESASETVHAAYKQTRELWEARFADLSRRREDLEQ